MPSKTITIIIPEEQVAKLTGVTDEQLATIIRHAAKGRIDQAIIERAAATERAEIAAMPEPSVSVE